MLSRPWRAVAALSLALNSGVGRVVAAESPAAAPLPASQLPLPGEIAMWGFVQGYDEATGNIRLKVISFALPNGRATRLPKPKEKTLQVTTQTAYLPEGNTQAPKWEAGLAVYVVGQDLGNGQPLPARMVFSGPRFSEDSRWGGPKGKSSSPAKATVVSYQPNRSANRPVQPYKLVDRGKQTAYVIRRFPLSRFTLQVSYVPSGHTAVGAVSRPGANSAVYAFGGGYFQPATKRTIDFLVVNGKAVDDYRWDWARPVIAVSGGEVKIIQADGRRQDPPGEFDWAMAVDYQATHRSAFVGRQIFGLTATDMVFVRCYSTEAAARRTMANLGVSNYVFLDGGSSTPPTSKIPTRLVVVAR